MSLKTVVRGPLLFVFLVTVAFAGCKEEEVVAVEPAPRPIKIYRLGGQLGDARPDYPGRIKAVKVVELAFEVEPGSAWLNRITNHFDKVAWLNPQPVEHWPYYQSMKLLD